MALPSNELNDLLFRCFMLDSLGNVALRVMLAAFVTDQDIEITDSSKGLILKSPDGTRYRVKAANGGTLTLTGL